MLIIPFDLGEMVHGRGPVVIVLILEPDNLNRMKKADPVDVQFRAFHQHMKVWKPIRDVDLIVAYESDKKQIMDFNEKHDLAGLMNWLERGRNVKPEDLFPPYKVGETK